MDTCNADLTPSGECDASCRHPGAPIEKIYGEIHEHGQSIRVTRYEPGPSAARFPAVFLRRPSRKLWS